MLYGAHRDLRATSGLSSVSGRNVESLSEELMITGTLTHRKRARRVGRGQTRLTRKAAFHRAEYFVKSEASFSADIKH